MTGCTEAVSRGCVRGDVNEASVSRAPKGWKIAEIACFALFVIFTLLAVANALHNFTEAGQHLASGVNCLATKLFILGSVLSLVSFVLNDLMRRRAQKTVEHANAEIAKLSPAFSNLEKKDPPKS